MDASWAPGTYEKCFVNNCSVIPGLGLRKPSRSGSRAKNIANRELDLVFRIRPANNSKFVETVYTCGSGSGNTK